MTCSVPDCGRRHYSRGFCKPHYMRVQRQGTPGPAEIRTRKMDRTEAFWARVNQTDGCWLWTGAVDQHGYGRMQGTGRRVYAHRFSYELHVGDIPEGLSLDHLCRVPACVNPAHLEPVTHLENVRRGATCNPELRVSA